MPITSDLNKMTVGDLLRRYINDPNLGGKSGRTKRYIQDRLLNCDIAEIKLTEFSANHVIDHCRYRSSAGAGPSTVNHDVSYLSSVLASEVQAHLREGKLTFTFKLINPERMIEDAFNFVVESVKAGVTEATVYDAQA
ncbi:hypothetical protein [Rosenbergiella gaditana]|uniref:hypothetical protein n=1 Tax=Rosenbergiella gaditana TaxID=2726987 RepID=UPI003084241E